MPYYHLRRLENEPRIVHSGYSLERDRSQFGGQSEYYYFPTSVSLSRYRTVYRVPGWKGLVKAGTQAATPYVRTESFMTQDDGTATIIWLDDVQNPSSRVFETFKGVPYPNTLSSHFAWGLKADNQALIRFYSAIKAEQEHFNALITLGELGETVRMLKKPFAGVQRTIESYLEKVETKARRMRWKRRKPLTGRQVNDLLTDAWLETSFGIRPLIADTVAIAETLARLAESPRRGAVQGYGEEETRLDPQHWDYEQVPSSFLAFDTIGDRKTVTKIKYRGGINVTVAWPDGSARRLRELAGFTPENFVPTVYNLLPWSFLADYFFNTGQCLSSYYTSTSALSWAIKSEVIKSERTWTHVVNTQRTKTLAGPRFVSCGGTLGKTVGQYLQFTRTILDLAELPLPLVDSRRLSDISPLQATNIIALLGAKVRRVRSVLLTASRG